MDHKKEVELKVNIEGGSLLAQNLGLHIVNTSDDYI